MSAIDKIKSRSLLVTCFVFCIGILGLSLMPQVDISPLFAAKILTGSITLILIPGVYLTNLLSEERINGLGFAFSFGFLYQLLNIYIAWWVSQCWEFTTR
jgi:hypothetical protein